MLRLKKKEADEKKAEEAEQAAAAELAAAAASPGPAAEEGGAEPTEPAAAGGVKLLGIGGRRLKKDKKPAAQRKTPGEIRIQKDIAELDGGDVADVTFPDPNNLTSFNVKCKPDTGFWKGACYDFSFTIPALYPHDPPKVLCKTKIYHPNINLQGNVCLNILREDWKPVLDINAVIYGLIYLFYEPNPDDPLNHEAAELYRQNIGQFEKKVKRSLQGGQFAGEIFPKLI